MSILRSPRARTLLLLGGLILALNAPGCGSSNSNEREFLSTADPGKEYGNPNESYSARRERTKHTVKKSATDTTAQKTGAAGKKTH
jgi:hypothetical protein